METCVGRWHVGAARSVKTNDVRQTGAGVCKKEDI